MNNLDDLNNKIKIHPGEFADDNPQEKKADNSINAAQHEHHHHHHHHHHSHHHRNNAKKHNFFSGFFGNTRKNHSKKSTDKLFWIILIVIVSLIIIGILFLVFYKPNKKNIGDTNQYGPRSGTVVSNSLNIPVDFVSLQTKNKDIYAWIDIPNTNVSYPILNHPNSNSFYMNHDSLGEYSISGSIFTEDYNSTDFSDPVTVIYGHHMNDGSMFGSVEKFYSNKEFFDNNRLIYIYLPNQIKKYKIFAAVPHSNEHILANHDFNYKITYDQFFEELLSSRGVNANISDDVNLKFGDNVIILSTCLTGNNSNRYLLCAVEIKK